MIAFQPREGVIRRLDTLEIVPHSKIQILVVPSMILEVGKNYSPDVGFSGLGKIPEDARGILLEETMGYRAEVNGSPVELIAGSYLKLKD